MKGQNTNAGFVGDDDGDVTLKSVVAINNEISRKTSEGQHHRWQNQIGEFTGSLGSDEKRSSARGEAKISVAGSSSSGLGSETASTEADADVESVEEEIIEADPGGKQVIAVLGSGDFGRALSGRLVQAGYTVNIGSRDPKRNMELVTKIGANPRFHDEAIRSSDIVIVAVPKDFYVDLPLDLFEGKVVVDVSNRNSVARKSTLSQAEYLQSLATESRVVKAFNVLSAYALESGGIQGSKEVFVAGNDNNAKDVVNNIIRSCSFTPVDMGSLRSAREIEDIPVQRFRSWKAPLVISTIIFVILWLLGFGKYQVCWTIIWGDGSWHWNRWNYLPMDTLNKTLCVHAITMLALCYLPGVLAAYLQIIRGTKYSRFPKWMDRWLKMRKQLGLLMLFSASLHACFSVAIMSPSYQELVYGYPKKVQVDILDGDAGIRANETVKLYGGKMEWRGELFLTCGVLSFALAVILGITSLPSVTATMTWKEFAFVQSKLGWICMILAGAHNLFYGWPYINSPSCSIPSSFQYCMYLPGLTMLLKIPLLFLSGYLDKIRGGWERGKGQKKGYLPKTDSA